MKNFVKRGSLPLCLLLLLSSCGTNRTDRTVMGTVMGAGAGAGIAAATGSIWIGPAILTLVGASAGGILGRHVPAETLYLGPAPWEFLFHEKRIEKGIDGRPRTVIRRVPKEQRLEKLYPF